MLSTVRTATAIASAAAVACGATATATAQDVKDFYRDHDITILVAFGAGGGYGLYSRTLSEHMSRHIPGHPNIILKFMPGAGGAKAANYFANVSPRNGSVMGLMSNSAALAQKMQPGLRYDASKFKYIGRMVDMRSALIVWQPGPVETLEGMKDTQVIFGTSGTSSQTYINAKLLKNVLNYNVKLVAGYSGSRSINNAMEKGEVHAMFNSWGSVKARLGHWLRDGKIKVLGMVGFTRAPDLPNVPTMLDMAETDEQKKLLELMAVTTEVGRAFSTTPGAPNARVAALRAAFDATLKDPKFLAAAKDRKMDLAYKSGKEVQKIVKRGTDASEELIQKFRAALELGNT